MREPLEDITHSLMQFHGSRHGPSVLLRLLPATMIRLVRNSQSNQASIMFIRLRHRQPRPLLYPGAPW